MSNEEDYYDLIKSLATQLPKTNDGRIDYTHAKKAAVLTIFIKHHNKILLLKRSQNVLTYKGKWNTVAGYLDQIIPIKNKIYEELSEELNIKRNDIDIIDIKGKYEFFDQDINRTWIIFPVLITLNHKPLISLDWEHTDYRWIDPENIDEYDTVPNAKKSLYLAIGHTD